MEKTDLLHKALSGLYVEFRKMVNAGMNDKHDELSWFLERMDKLADEIIKLEIHGGKKMKNLGKIIFCIGLIFSFLMTLLIILIGEAEISQDIFGLIKLIKVYTISSYLMIGGIGVKIFFT